jgi:inosose dehydratase
MAMTRRTATQALLLGIGAASLATVPSWAQKKRNIRVGHTGITWPWGQISAGRGQGAAPPRVNADAIETVFKDVSSLGFSGLELFSWQIEGMEANGGLMPFIEKYKLPLVSSYTGMNLTDAARRQDVVSAAVATAKIVKKNGGKIIVVGPNGVPRASYVFADHKADIIATLNDAAKAIVDVGLTPVLHQHTGTCIESREETYAIMQAVDTRYLKFGPDIGQLQKGGSDPVQVIKDFLPLIQHMHLKDYVGGAAYLGYCPLGQGKVNIPAILDMMDGKSISGMIMVELDSSADMPTTPLESATIARKYLDKEGVRLGDTY